MTFAPAFDHRGREAGGLRIVDQDDVVRPDEREQLVGVLAQRLLVVFSLGVSECAAVAGRAVKPVVDALGDLEEGGVTLDHEPADVEAGAATVGEKGLQHLGDPAAGRGRVDVQHRPPSQQQLGCLGNRFVACGPVRADQWLEPRGVERLHVDLLDPGVLLDAHLVLPISSAHASTASQSRASLAGMRLRGKWSFAGSITPPNTAIERGSTSGTFLQCFVELRSRLGQILRCSGLWPQREDRHRQVRQLAPMLRQEASRVPVPASEIQRAPEDDTFVGLQILDLRRATELDLTPGALHLRGDRLCDLLGRSVLAPVGDEQRHGITSPAVRDEARRRPRADLRLQLGDCPR